jgi:hypothetical protein
VDGVAVASLVVSAASMAWTIYNDIAEGGGRIATS